MQLHVLGPAFGLPSIDAECIATIALLQSQTIRQWTVHPTHDFSLRLPYLRYGSECIEGFKDITRYFHGEDSSLTASQQADASAISSFIESRAQALLDISLYVAYDNYLRTRSAFTTILPWYANYTIPPRRREDAKKRIEHLGISSIDVDDVHEDLSNRPAGFDVGKEQKFEAETQKKASLLLPRKDTVRSLLRRPEHAAVFKLSALADNFFEPLQRMLGDGEFFLGTGKPQAIDCLAYGSLSLMLFPDLPQSWLAKTLRSKYPKLVAYTENMHETLGTRTDAEKVMLLTKRVNEDEIREFQETHGISLPWAPRSPLNVTAVIQTTMADLLSQTPWIGPSRVKVVPCQPHDTAYWQSKYFPASLAVIATFISLFGYYAFSTGIFEWPRGEQVQVFGRKRLADYGHLGAALAGISVLGRQMNDNVTLHPQDTSEIPVRVEVEAEKDGIP